MTEPGNHLAADLKALRYLDALDEGDLDTVSALWDEAINHPELERTLAELDGALFQEIPGNPILIAERLGQRRRRWAVLAAAVSTLAAACLLAMLAWPRPDTKNQISSRPVTTPRIENARRPPDLADDLIPSLRARRDPDKAAIPRFVWPLENRLSASTPLDLLD